MKSVLVLMLLAIVVHCGKADVQPLQDTSMDTQREKVEVPRAGLERLQPETIASKASNDGVGIQKDAGQDLETAQSLFLGFGLGGFGGGYGGGWGGGYGGGYGHHHHHHHHHGGYGHGWGWGR